MAHTILVRLDVDDEYADIHPEITATDYLGGSKAYGWEVVTERVFTESEVRAIMGPLVALSSARLNQITVKGVEYIEAENVEFAFGQLKAIAVRLGLYSDPA